MKKKIIIDMLMFILILLEFSRGYMKPIYHEIIGILLFILVIIHLILNRNYIKSISIIVNIFLKLLKRRINNER